MVQSEPTFTFPTKPDGRAGSRCDEAAVRSAGSVARGRSATSSSLMAASALQSVRFCSDPAKGQRSAHLLERTFLLDVCPCRHCAGFLMLTAMTTKGSNSPSSRTEARSLLATLVCLPPELAS